MGEKIAVAIISAALSGGLTYGTKALTLEGKVDSMQQSIQRIEAHIFKVPAGDRN